MPVEAELKARVRDPDRVRELLLRRADERVDTYRDTYYDRSDQTLSSQDRELRVRVIESAAGSRTVLTYKGPAVDAASDAKPEVETEVADAGAIRTILRNLGYVELISFTKYCRNYRFTSSGRSMLATLVTVPEIDGVFLELETITELDDLADALRTVQHTLGELGIGAADLTTERYTDAVRASR